MGSTDSVGIGGSVCRALGTLGLLAAGGLTWGIAEAHLFALRRVEVPVLPVGSTPLKVLHISDIHLMPHDRAKQRFVRGLAELEPDLVVNTGDNMSSTRSLTPLLETLDGLLDVPGVFVFGSNDYSGPRFKNPFMYLLRGRSEGVDDDTVELPWREMREAFTDRGWRDLTHTRTSLELAGHRIDFRGTDDGHLERDRYQLVAGPVDPAADLTIGVTHAPYLRLLDAMTADGVDLVMAGHTHGGQVCLPTGALITNCDLDTARVKGLNTHTSGGRTSFMHVSAGIGSSPFAPYRTFCRPEATLLTLVPRST